MKATILVRDLVKLIAKHGDLDVRMCASYIHEVEVIAKSLDELRGATDEVIAFELYGEEK